MTRRPCHGHLAPIAPAMSGNGLAMRVALFSEALAMHGPSDVFALGEGPAGHSVPRGARYHLIPAGGDGDARLRLVKRMPVGPGTQALRALGRPVASAALSPPVLERIARIAALRSWQGLVLSRAYMAPALAAIPSIAEGPVMMDLDDDDAALLRKRAAIARSRGDRDGAAWLEAEADAFDAAILAAAPRVAVFTAASDEVRASVDARLAPGRIVTVPNAMPPAPDRRAPGPRDGLIFVGNLGYEPNTDGLLWFVREVWPHVRAAAGATRLRICGSGPSPQVARAAAAPGVELHADPADLTALYARSSVAIAPLRLGSGTRIKILEAAAQGVPVVATGKAAEGLAPSIIAEIAAGGDNAEGFARRCVDLLDDPAAAARRAARLRVLVALHHDRPAVVRALADLMGEAFRIDRVRSSGAGGGG